MVDLPGLRKTSEALTGRMYRLEIGAAIHVQEGEPFTATEIHEATQIVLNRVTDDLKRLREAELIREVDDVRGRSDQMKAEPHPYWEFCYQAASQFGWEPR